MEQYVNTYKLYS